MSCCGARDKEAHLLGGPLAQPPEETFDSSDCPITAADRDEPVLSHKSCFSMRQAQGPDATAVRLLHRRCF